MRINKNLGFTVAEVLITIGVIGILTMIFTTITNGRNTTTWQKSNDYKLGIVKYDKIYNALNENITKQLMRNNDISNLNNLLENALNTLNSTCTDCANNRANNPQGNNLSNLSRVLGDGSEITVYSHNGKIDNNDIKYIVYVDTNGKEKPNTIGKDILPIYIDKDGNVINVNPKTGKTFRKLSQKKYDSDKTYQVQCPNENITLNLRKNPKTGLYEDVNNQKCSKICKKEIAKQKFANDKNFPLSSIVETTNGFKYTTTEKIYTANYDSTNCYSGYTITDNECSVDKAKQQFASWTGCSNYTYNNGSFSCIIQTSGKYVYSKGENYSIKSTTITSPETIKYSAIYNKKDCIANYQVKVCQKKTTTKTIPITVTEYYQDKCKNVRSGGKGARPSKKKCTYTRQIQTTTQETVTEEVCEAL